MLRTQPVVAEKHTGGNEAAASASREMSRSSTAVGVRDCSRGFRKIFWGPTATTTVTAILDLNRTNLRQSTPRSRHSAKDILDIDLDVQLLTIFDCHPRDSMPHVPYLDKQPQQQINLE